MNKLEELRQQREENFKKIGQYLLQKKYYENYVNQLLITQEKLCDDIFYRRILEFIIKHFKILNKLFGRFRFFQVWLRDKGVL